MKSYQIQLDLQKQTQDKQITQLIKKYDQQVKERHVIDDLRLKQAKMLKKKLDTAMRKL